MDDLAERTNDNLSLDGGPGFARMSICRGTVPLKEYQRYCNAEADGDSTPLYIFDPDILKATFVDGTLVADDYHCQNRNPGTLQTVNIPTAKLVRKIVRKA